MALNSLLRSLPSVDSLLSSAEMTSAIGTYSRPVVTEVIREVLDEARAGIRDGARSAASREDLLLEVMRRLARNAETIPVSVINATGVIIHTNLGRAPLSEDSIRAMTDVSGDYCALEFDIASGTRGSRLDLIENDMCALTGAESAIVVNNNAAAVLLALSALVGGGEAIVSRGQLVEVGGGFRIPDVMRQSGARLVEVGTTNRTYAADYDAAAGSDTRAIMSVHTSNFRVIGFTHAPTTRELSEVARARGVLLIDDLGSGALLDTAKYGLMHEPTVQESVAAGSDVVCFSGDKLVGGPQAGICVGTRSAIARMRQHPLARAMRSDKSSLAALSATTRHYLRGEAEVKVPVWKMIAMSVDEIERRASAWRERLAAECDCWVDIIDGESTVGGGSLPGGVLRTKLLAIASGSEPDASGASDLSRRLRLGRPSIVARIERGLVLLDPRTVPPAKDHLVSDALVRACKRDA